MEGCKGHRIVLGILFCTKASPLSGCLLLTKFPLTSVNPLIRYFHPPVENAIGLVVGAILFQAPTVLFNLKCLQSAYLIEKRGADTEFLTSNGRAHVSPPKVQ